MADAPIQVSPTPLPATIGTALRYALTFLAGLAITHKVLPADTDVNTVVGAGVALVSAAYGVYAAFKNHKDKKTMLPYTPDSVAQLKR